MYFSGNHYIDILKYYFKFATINIVLDEIGS